MADTSEPEGLTNEGNLFSICKNAFVFVDWKKQPDVRWTKLMYSHLINMPGFLSGGCRQAFHRPPSIIIRR